MEFKHHHCSSIFIEYSLGTLLIENTKLGPRKKGKITILFDYKIHFLILENANVVFSATFIMKQVKLRLTTTSRETTALSKTGLN